MHSRTNRQLSTSPIPLAPHLARDWCPWLPTSESESEGEMETVHTLDKYHKKIHLVCTLVCVLIVPSIIPFIITPTHSTVAGPYLINLGRCPTQFDRDAMVLSDSTSRVLD